MKNNISPTALTKARRKFQLAGFLVTIAAGFSFLLPGCTGNTGQPGAAGPPGAGNIAGVNIAMFTVSKGAWFVASGNPTPYLFFPHAIDSINDLNNVIIEVYYNDSTKNGPIWTSVPSQGMQLFRKKNFRDTMRYGTDTIDQLTYSWQPGAITVQYSFLGGLACIQPKRPVFFYVSVIPLKVIKMHPKTNWKDPYEVLNLPEMQAALNKAIH